MLVIPAIDLKDGRVVRLTQGDFRNESQYPDHPVVWAKKWEFEGARWIHVVDLDGARTGCPAHLSTLREIVKSVKVKIEFGGGLRIFESVKQVLDVGVARAIIGTKALDQTFLELLVNKFGNQIAIGLDLKDGKFQTTGWQEEKTIESVQAECSRFEAAGVQTLILTDTSRDGTLKGPNVSLLRQILEATRSGVIHSGGIGALSDLNLFGAINQTHFQGVIIGKALYENRISLKEAIQRFQ